MSAAPVIGRIVLEEESLVALEALRDLLQLRVDLFSRLAAGGHASEIVGQDERLEVQSFVEYGRLNVNHPGGGPLVWLAEPRGRAFATHQRTVRVTFGDPEPVQ